VKSTNGNDKEDVVTRYDILEKELIAMKQRDDIMEGNLKT
jgi:hypothetical protein